MTVQFYSPASLASTEPTMAYRAGEPTQAGGFCASSGKRAELCCKMLKLLGTSVPQANESCAKAFHSQVQSLFFHRGRANIRKLREVACCLILLHIASMQDIVSSLSWFLGREFHCHLTTSLAVRSPHELQQLYSLKDHRRKSEQKS